MMSVRRRPVVLCVLDGWGHRDDPHDNAIAAARTPNYTRLMQTCPVGFLDTSAESVGLPHGQMGNSEVGHMNLGAGRVVEQLLPRIDTASGAGFTENAGLQKFIAALKESRGTAHVMGLLSTGGVHSHLDHFAPLVQAVARAGIPVRMHAFTDGRDTPPKSALDQFAEFEARVANLGNFKFATVIGRYFAMDRDRRWDRTERAFHAIAQAEGQAAITPRAAIEAAYARGETDEFIQPTVIGHYRGINEGDGILVVNFRSDRVRQTLSALVEPEFEGFARAMRPKLAVAAGMTDYSEALSARLITLFPQQPLHGTLGEIVSRAGKKQLRIAETEKYAHVTFFFNGGEETQFAGEDRILVPSPKVATYDLKPEMSAVELTDRLVAAVVTGTYDFILVNYANADMVGHSGILEAATKAIETVDACLGRLETAVVKTGGVLFITADHGNAEMMRDNSTGQPHTAHTTNPVPAILVNAPAEITGLAHGRLADVAPTLLPFLGLEQPAAMTGKNLLVMNAAVAAKRAGRAV